MPTLHVWGQKDDLVPADYSKELVALFPSAVTFEHPTGHVVPVRVPFRHDS
jgi:pimeloyl-ACP methyl ester carboxylesterase